MNRACDQVCMPQCPGCFEVISWLEFNDSIRLSNILSYFTSNLPKFQRSQNDLSLPENSVLFYSEHIIVFYFVTLNAERLYPT